MARGTGGGRADEPLDDEAVAARWAELTASLADIDLSADALDRGEEEQRPGARPAVDPGTEGPTHAGPGGHQPGRADGDRPAGPGAGHAASRPEAPGPTGAQAPETPRPAGGASAAHPTGPVAGSDPTDIRARPADTPPHPTDTPTSGGRDGAARDGAGGPTDVPGGTAAPPGPRDYSPAEDEEGFVPPEPEPWIGGDPVLLLGWFATVGPVLVTALLAVVWRPLPGTVLGVAGLVLIAGVALLLWRMPAHRDHDDPSGGAVV